MAAALAFMDSPLVTWVKTFQDNADAVDFQELCDGAFLNDVLIQIFDQPDLELEKDVKRVTRDTNGRLQNWALLLGNLRLYYQDVLGQLVVMEMPDLVSMVKEPTKESSLWSMKRLLLLLLGCAVQCDRKEHYINIIKGLDLTVQRDIVAHIQEVTDRPENVLTLEAEDEMCVKDMLGVVSSVTSERDRYMQSCLLLSQERDYYQQELRARGGLLTPPQHLEKHHLAREAADLRARNQALSLELEEKMKIIAEMTDDLDQTKGSVWKIKSENITLSKDAKVAQSYRDELDELQEKAVKADKLEKELAKCKDRLKELDYFKSRVEELRRDNDAQAEGRARLEAELEAAQRKATGLMDEMVRAQRQLDNSTTEKELLSEKLQQLADENTALEMERSRVRDGCAGGTMRRMSGFSSSECLHISQLSLSAHPISDELNETMTSQLNRLELERDGLQRELSASRLEVSDLQRELAALRSQMGREASSLRADLERSQRGAQREAERVKVEAEKELRLERTKLTADLTKKFKDKVSLLEQDASARRDRLARNLEEEKTNLARTLHEKHASEKRDLEEEREHLRQELTNLKVAMGDLAQSHEEVRARTESAEAEKERLRQEIGALTAELAVASEKATTDNEVSVREAVAEGVRRHGEELQAEWSNRLEGSQAVARRELTTVTSHLREEASQRLEGVVRQKVEAEAELATCRKRHQLELESKEAEVVALRGARERLQREVTGLTGKLVALEVQREKELSDLRVALTDLGADRDKEVTGLNARLADLEAERGEAVTGLRTQLADLEAKRDKEVASLRVKLADLGARRDKEVTDLRVTLAGVEAQRDKEVTALKVTLADLEAKRDREVTDLKVKQADLGARRDKEVTDLTVTLAGVEAQRDKEVTALRATLADLEAKRDREVSELSVKQAALEAEREQEVTMAVALQGQRQGREALTQEECRRKKTAAELFATREENDSLQQQTQQLRQAQKELKKTAEREKRDLLNAYQDQKADLEKKNKELVRVHEEERTSLEREKAQLERQLAAAQEHHRAEVEQERYEMRKKVEEKTQMLTLVKDAWQREKEQCSQIERRKSSGDLAAERRCGELAAQLRQLEQEKRELQGVLTLTKHTLDEVRAQLDRVRKEAEHDIKVKVTEMETNQGRCPRCGHYADRSGRSLEQEKCDLQRDLTLSFRKQVDEVKTSLLSEHQREVELLEDEIGELRESVKRRDRDLVSARDACRRDQQRCAALEAERTHSQEQLLSLQESASQRIRQLQEELDLLQSGAEAVTDHTERIHGLSGSAVRPGMRAGLGIPPPRGSRPTSAASQDATPGGSRCQTPTNSRPPSPTGSWSQTPSGGGRCQTPSGSLCQTPSSSRCQTPTSGVDHSAPYANGHHSHGGHPMDPHGTPGRLAGHQGADQYTDILRNKPTPSTASPNPSLSSRRGHPVTRSASVMGVPHERRPGGSTAPVQGVVTPQGRAPSTPQHTPQGQGEQDGPFSRGDQLRATVGPGGGRDARGVSRPLSEHGSFSRQDPLRSTMPERRTLPVAPADPRRRRQPPPPPPSTSRSGSVSSVNSDLQKEPRSSAGSGGLPPEAWWEDVRLPSRPPSALSLQIESSSDSGYPTSPGSLYFPEHALDPDSSAQDQDRDHDRSYDDHHHSNNNNKEHRLTSVQIVSSETIRSRFRLPAALSPRSADKWRSLVGRLVDLQDSNQRLILDNSKLKRSLNGVRFAADRADLLENRNLELQQENRKLRKIVEGLQCAITGKNPYDKRTYHFYSNC